MTQFDNPKKSMQEAYDELEQDMQEGSPSEPDMSRIVNLEGVLYAPDDILKVRTAVFQPRSLQGQLGEEAHLTREIIDALKRGGAEVLDPVVIWWSGRRFIVVDGHHRLIAIRKYNHENRQRKGFRKIRVPVTVITGEIAEAKVHSTRENAKAKLSLRKEDRVNWAWKQVVLHFGGVDRGKFVMAQRCRDLHVSERLLQQMKATFKKLVELDAADPDPVPRVDRRNPAGAGFEPDNLPDREWVFAISELSWGRAQRMAEGVSEFDEEFTNEKRQRAIDAAVIKLTRALGPEAFSDPRSAEITGEAILAISNRFLELAGWSPDFLGSMKQALHALSGDNLAGLDEDFE
ncbi:hypothetical protein ACFQ3C_05040 [Seohaeicola saemankumensis]|uniref:ParB/Sulfiredoxin domain-containing protein n=1 Tax=Seohaeicola saemankumensis TaxID=481181 RepID=A0ABW3TC49_9RHOB